MKDYDDISNTYSDNKSPHSKTAYFAARWQRYRQTKQQRLAYLVCLKDRL